MSNLCGMSRHSTSTISSPAVISLILIFSMSLGFPALGAVLLEVVEGGPVPREQLVHRLIALQQGDRILIPRRLGQLTRVFERLSGHGKRPLRRIDRGDTRPWGFTATATEDHRPGDERADDADARNLLRKFLVGHFIPPSSGGFAGPL